MNDLAPFMLVLLVGAGMAAAHASRFPGRDGQLLMASFGAHVFAMFVQVWFALRVYGFGDVLGYTDKGEVIAAALRTDFGQFAPEVFNLLFQRPAVIPFPISGAGSSTGSMAAVAGIITYVTGGSLYTLSACVMIPAYFGQTALYAAFRDAFPRSLHRSLLVAAMLIPSEVYWTSALIKESVASVGLGLMVYGVGRLLQQIRLGPLLSTAVGATILMLFKPYILFAVAIASGAWFYLKRGAPRAELVSPGRVAFGTVVILVGAMVLFRVFPEYSPNSFAERAAYLQESGQELQGASSYSIGDPTQTTFAGQIVYAPLALITSIFRPFFFEARSPQVLVNSIETTVFLVLLVRALRESRARQLWNLTRRFPMLAFCAVFVVLFGIGVGLTTTNLGTLSRYRMPLVPFAWAALLVLRESNRVTAEHRQNAARELSTRTRTQRRRLTPGASPGAAVAPGSSS